MPGPTLLGRLTWQGDQISQVSQNEGFLRGGTSILKPCKLGWFDYFWLKEVLISEINVTGAKGSWIKGCPIILTEELGRTGAVKKSGITHSWPKLGAGASGKERHSREKEQHVWGGVWQHKHETFQKEKGQGIESGPKWSCRWWIFAFYRAF